jgi:hypothetical protein
MSGKTLRIFTVSVLLTAGAMRASAETAAPPESVTISATRLREIFHKFEDVFVSPTPIGGKIARWQRPICPVVVGQASNFTRFIAQHVKYVALAAGARVNTEASCKPNIEIVFTTTPQTLLDSVHKKEPVYLGYAETNAQLERLATVTRPVQAWYTTETEDWNGRRQVDSVLWLMPDRDPMFDVPNFASSGSRINEGGRSGFNHILIVIDSTKLAGQRIVPLADYVSMLALTQFNSLDACQELPSIVSMLAVRCEHAPDGLTKYDLAYLQGLYHMTTGRNMVAQRGEIGDLMTDRLAEVK